MTVWMAVGPPPLSLPLAVADSPKELAEMLHVSRTAIIEHVCRARIGKVKVEKYMKVEIGDETEEV